MLESTHTLGMPRCTWLLLVAGLGLFALGVLTATDAISLRAVAARIDVPYVSMAVINLRDAMPTRLAHVLEPLCALVGLSSVLAGRTAQ
jgi:hypothetical protein